MHNILYSHKYNETITIVNSLKELLFYFLVWNLILLTCGLWVLIKLPAKRHTVIIFKIKTVKTRTFIQNDNEIS